MTAAVRDGRGRFVVEHFTGTAADLHGIELLDPARPRIVVADVTGAALVLGSSQRDDVADADACRSAGVEVVRRRSGGGAVLVEPGAMCWFDVVVPADVMPLVGCPDDVAGSMTWLGSHIAGALRRLGVADIAVHDGPMSHEPWSRLVCFAGVGPGEVLLGGGGTLRKLVGISQRRRRSGARFQCMVHTRWNPARLVDLLAEPRLRAEQLPAVATLDAAVGRRVPHAVVDALHDG